MTEVSTSLVLRLVVKSPRQSCISKGFIRTLLTAHRYQNIDLPGRRISHWEWFAHRRIDSQIGGGRTLLAPLVFVASTHPSRTWTPRSFESVRWSAYMSAQTWTDLYSHPKEIWGNGVRTHLNSKGKIPYTGVILPRGVSNPQRCMKQDSEPNTLPTRYFGPPKTV